MLTIGPLTWIGSIFLFFYGPRRWRGPVTYSMIISPLGTLARYHLAKLNTLTTSTKTGFPLGTFLANIIATALLSVFTLLQLLSHDPELCGGLQGLKDGFCGCLSTISTFFVELRKIKPISRAVRYGLVSWISGQLLCVLLLGVYLWSHPLVRDQCQFPTWAKIDCEGATGSWGRIRFFITKNVSWVYQQAATQDVDVHERRDHRTVVHHSTWKRKQFIEHHAFEDYDVVGGR